MRLGDYLHKAQVEESVHVYLLHCMLSLAVQCIVISPVCGIVWVCVCVGLLPR